MELLVQQCTQIGDAQRAQIPYRTQYERSADVMARLPDPVTIPALQQAADVTHDAARWYVMKAVQLGHLRRVGYRKSRKGKPTGIFVKTEAIVALTRKLRIGTQE